jgi:hypothetical protein
VLMLGYPDYTRNNAIFAYSRPPKIERVASQGVKRQIRFPLCAGCVRSVGDWMGGEECGDELALVKSDFGNGRMCAAMFRHVLRRTGIPDRHTGCRCVCRLRMPARHTDRGRLWTPAPLPSYPEVSVGLSRQSMRSWSQARTSASIQPHLDRGPFPRRRRFGKRPWVSRRWMCCGLYGTISLS